MLVRGPFVGFVNMYAVKKSLSNTVPLNYRYGQNEQYYGTVQAILYGTALGSLVSVIVAEFSDAVNISDISISLDMLSGPDHMSL